MKAVAIITLLILMLSQIQSAYAGDTAKEVLTVHMDENVEALIHRIGELERLVSELKRRVEELEAGRDAEKANTGGKLLSTRLRDYPALQGSNLWLSMRYAPWGLLRVVRLNGGTPKGQRIRNEQPQFETVQPSSSSAALGGAGLWQAMNPDISLIGGFAMRLGGKNPLGSYRGAALRSVEIALQAYADPFGRLDTFVEHTQEGTHICQAELSLLDPSVLRLPKGFQIRGGILLANVGKLNTIHAHEQPLADLPLLHKFFYSHPPEENHNSGNQNSDVSNLLRHIIEHGGHNFHGTGARISYLLPTKSPRQAHEISIEALNTHNLTFDCGSGRPLLLSRWRSFFELAPVEKTLDLGLNYGYGPNSFGGNTHLYSVDLTYRWRPIEAGLYRSLSWYNEFAVARQSGANGSRSATGFFSMVEYQFSRTFYLGARYDWASLPDSSAHGSGVSFALTYYPSEFSRYRLQLNRRKYSLLGTSWDLILEMTFSIGVHRPHPF
ncbi:MAG: hypothetical protein RMK18_01345 [Armatimonadota bacterium]|nr:hypothetical protein [Armatimonadota bacterium]MCX7778146.1 hypothetical protein [Armatimonadota bacterium]MDW8024500.1 hypothetical protein [Armatimonadota bacterium]